MIISIIAGARPNFMKIAPLIRAIEKAKSSGRNIDYRLVHTGQHYDHKMSETFFQELGIPAPHVNLEVGSGTQSVQTGNIMIRFEEYLSSNPVDVVLVVGDVNSTLACSVVAKKMSRQLIHVEAGIRSYDMEMPEEINRIVTDALSDHFYTTTAIAGENLMKSGIDASRIHFVGNTMIDTLMANLDRIKKPALWEENGLEEKNYILLTLHRPANVDDPENLRNLLNKISSGANGKIIFPAHPRTVNIMKQAGINPGNMILVEPLGYLEFIYLVKNAGAVVTDSGGIQEETTVLKVPCMTLRKNTERPETILEGTNELLGTDPSAIEPAFLKLNEGKWKTGNIPSLWDGHAAERIVDSLLEIYKF